MAAQDPTVSAESNGAALVVTASTMLGLSWFSVLLRSYVRASLTKGFQLDDWVMLLAQANLTVSCAFILRGCYHGLGRHNKSLDQTNEIQALKYQALATATYVSNMWLVKLSIGIFLLRLSDKRRYTYILYVSLAVVGISSLVLFFWNLFQCNPLRAQWDYTILQTDPNAHCVSPDAVVNAAYALSVITVLSDWLYALLPIPMIWNVKMTTQTKITVTLVLGLGVFASIATLIRLKFLSDLTNLEDILYAGTDAMVWTLIEPGLAIMASSLATVRPLLRIWRVKGFNSTGDSNRTGRSHPSHVRSVLPGYGFSNATSEDMELDLIVEGHQRHSAKTRAETRIVASKPQTSPLKRLSEVSIEAQRRVSRHLPPGFRRIEIIRKGAVSRQGNGEESGSDEATGGLGPGTWFSGPDSSRASSPMEMSTTQPRSCLDYNDKGRTERISQCS